MHKIAVSAAITAILLKLPTRGFAKVGNRRKVSNNGAAGVESSVERGEGLGSLVLFAKLNVHIADHVIRKIVTNIEAFDLAKLGELGENIFEEILEVLLDLARV